MPGPAVGGRSCRYPPQAAAALQAVRESGLFSPLVAAAASVRGGGRPPFFGHIALSGGPPGTGELPARAPRGPARRGRRWARVRNGREAGRGVAEAAASVRPGPCLPRPARPRHLA